MIGITPIIYSEVHNLNNQQMHHQVYRLRRCKLCYTQ